MATGAEATSTVLGLPGDLTRDESRVDFSVTKVGGDVVVPQGFRFPSGSTECETCGAPMTLVMQVRCLVRRR